MPKLCRHCHKEIYLNEEQGIWKHGSNFQEKCNVNFINLPVAEPEEESIKEFRHTMATDNRINGLKIDKVWIDEFYESMKNTKERKLMSKEKENEYIFKVENFDQIDVERIARENPNKEMILVIPEDDKIARLLVDDGFLRKHRIGMLTETLCAKGKADTGYVGDYATFEIRKEDISAYIEAYNKTKAKESKMTVRVKTFGDTIPF